MTHPENKTTEEIPSLEPWLAVAILSLVPMAAAFILHADFMPYLLSFGATLSVASLVMLVRQERGKRR